MTVRVETLAEADAQLEALDTWWREHRADAADQVLTEFVRVVDLLGKRPGIGAKYTRLKHPHLRWIRLRKTPYLVIYEHVPGSDLVSIVSVWSGQRGRPAPVR